LWGHGLRSFTEFPVAEYSGKASVFRLPSSLGRTARTLPVAMSIAFHNGKYISRESLKGRGKRRLGIVLISSEF
jgi:hypothetical protein